MEKLQFGRLNVLIGSNGSGKSNLVSFFRMLSKMMAGHLQEWVTQQGRANRILSFGMKETAYLDSAIYFGLNGYEFRLAPTVEEELLFRNENIYFQEVHYGPQNIYLGAGHKESKIKDYTRNAGAVVDYCYDSISNWKVYHFHDTSHTAGMKRFCSVHDNEYLRTDASNLAAFLYRLLNDFPDVYEQVRKTVRLAIPFFDDFVLKPRQLKTGEEQIQLLWRQRGSDYAFLPSQLSDGSVRFICLVAALLQPDPPSTIIIDEPELGLHPYAITLLGALLRSVSSQMQVVVSTQSVPLVNEFSIDDLIVVEREQGDSVFQRRDAREFKEWLDEYSIGELWEKNILGGRPSK